MQRQPNVFMVCGSDFGLIQFPPDLEVTVNKVLFDENGTISVFGTNNPRSTLLSGGQWL